MRAARWMAGLALAAWAGCAAGPGGGNLYGEDAGVSQGADLASWLGDGSASAIAAQVGFAGCPALTGDGGVARCTGTAPLSVTLVPITPSGASSVLWSLSDGGAPAMSSNSSAMVSWVMPGLYPVQLAVMFGAAGQAIAAAEVSVLPSPNGGACSVSAQCSQGDDCRCAPSGDAGSACPAELAGGLCTRLCAGGGCDSGEACIDLSRSAASVPALADEPYRRPICLPTCTTSADCRAGFACRELPALADGAAAGGLFTWRKACFASVLWDVGHSCADGDGDPSPGECVGGECVTIGARDLCSSPCADGPCPSTAACATFNFDPAHPLCLPRCDQTHPCTDPLLACQSAGGGDAGAPTGWYGFTVGGGEAVGATYCAPIRCATDKDCAPAGHCTTPGNGFDGGVQPTSFCTP